MTTTSQVGSLYKTVVDDVITNVKEAFLDEGVDEQVLQELRQLWESKLAATKATEPVPEPEIRMTHPPVGILYQPPDQSQGVQQGFVSGGAVLAAAAQQPQQSFPVSITTNRQQEMTGAAQQATMALPMGLFQQQLAALGASGQNVTLQATANGQYIAVQNIGGQQTAITIPQQAFVQHPGAIQTQHIAGVNQHQHQQQRQHPGNPTQPIIQLDGTGDGSSSSDEDFDNDDNDDDNEEEHNEEEEQGEEEEPLNSDDDVSEEDPHDLFDSENVIVCQYDKINRNKNKWKFHLKDGIMNLNGKDYVFQRANGDAEW
ncbi:transcription initiation factor IIA subunit 1-like [Littorina saxatilis]|uniref:Transcription initiation factor IIA subunit 1 n=1 Tax=Littorina saxatilis TaxID=31220 RepID=A0AAN9GD31_9CAEN